MILNFFRYPGCNGTVCLPEANLCSVRKQKSKLPPAISAQMMSHHIATTKMWIVVFLFEAALDQHCVSAADSNLGNDAKIELLQSRSHF